MLSLELIYTMILAAAPFSECRGAIIYGLAVGLNPYIVYFLSILMNILVVPVIFWFLNKAHFMNLAHKILGKKITRTIEKNKKKFEVYEELALLGFVAIPMIGTGAWTGTLLASVLELDIKKSFMVISFGVIIAGTIMFIGTTGFISIF